MFHIWWDFLKSKKVFFFLLSKKPFVVSSLFHFLVHIQTKKKNNNKPMEKLWLNKSSNKRSQFFSQNYEKIDYLFFIFVFKNFPFCLFIFEDSYHKCDSSTSLDGHCASEPHHHSYQYQNGQFCRNFTTKIMPTNIFAPNSQVSLSLPSLSTSISQQQQKNVFVCLFSFTLFYYIFWKFQTESYQFFWRNQIKFRNWIF